MAFCLQHKCPPPQPSPLRSCGPQRPCTSPQGDHHQVTSQPRQAVLTSPSSRSNPPNRAKRHQRQYTPFLASATMSTPLQASSTMDTAPLASRTMSWQRWLLQKPSRPQRKEVEAWTVVSIESADVRVITQMLYNTCAVRDVMMLRQPYTRHYSDELGGPMFSHLPFCICV